MTYEDEALDGVNGCFDAHDCITLDPIDLPCRDTSEAGAWSLSLCVCVRICFVVACANDASRPWVVLRDPHTHTYTHTYKQNPRTAEAQPVALMEGQWWATLGGNAVYDCYLCQVRASSLSPVSSGREAKEINTHTHTYIYIYT